MVENFWIAVQISLVGMGLVFGAILLLWGLMALLVRLTTEKGEELGAAPLPSSADEMGLKRQAAAAAVAAALAADSGPEANEFPLPPTALVSPWQGVMRTRMLNKRGQVR